MLQRDLMVKMAKYIARRECNAHLQRIAELNLISIISLCDLIEWQLDDASLVLLLLGQKEHNLVMNIARVTKKFPLLPNEDQETLLILEGMTNPSRMLYFCRLQSWLPDDYQRLLVGELQV